MGLRVRGQERSCERYFFFLFSIRMTFSYPMYKDTTGPGQYKVTVRWASIRIAMLCARAIIYTLSYSQL